uniref:Uncharacterized protein n=1 Tax=Strongyloides venezuelensis TaxID=75913 RepID=A0A0K0EY90_STRVS
MDNLQNSRRQSFLGLSQANKNISVLSEYSSNTQYHFKKSNNRISSKFLDHQTNLEKTNDFRNLNIIPFAKTRYSQLYFNSRSFYGRQNSINNANTSFKENVKEKSSSEKPSYSQNDVDDILIKFLESEKDKTNNRNICRGKLLEESSKKSVLCSRTDIDAVLKAFLNSKKTYDDSLSNESIKNLSFSEKYNSSDVSNVLSNQNISTKEEIPSDSPLNNFIIAQTTDSESFVTGISKELFDSKTRMKKHKNDVIHIFDYNYEKLKHNPEEKVKHCIESLETVEKCTFFLNIFYNFLPPKLSNILVISSEKRILHNHFDSLLQIDSIESNPPISQEFFTTNDFNQTDQGTSENIEINMNESSNFNNSSKLEIFES